MANMGCLFIKSSYKIVSSIVGDMYSANLISKLKTWNHVQSCENKNMHSSVFRTFLNISATKAGVSNFYHPELHIKCIQHGGPQIGCIVERFI